jgi:translation elongation factor EF-Tu-like GTPase
MKTAEEGGRQCGFASGYRPNHVFELPRGDEKLLCHVGDIRFEGKELIEPGETAIVTVRFLRSPLIAKYMNVGQKWYINEAARTFGYGEILEVINP